MVTHARKKRRYLIALPPIAAAALVAAALLSSGAPPGGSATMMDLAGTPAAASVHAAHQDVGVPLTAGARHELGALSARVVLAHRAQVRHRREVERRRARHRAMLAAQRQAQAAVSVAAPMGGGSLQQLEAEVFGSQAGCADEIVQHESGGNVYATNPTTGAYGLGQALPPGKMAVAGADWATDARTQLEWLQIYADTTYGGICEAWGFWQTHSYY